MSKCNNKNCRHGCKYDKFAPSLCKCCIQDLAAEDLIETYGNTEKKPWFQRWKRHKARKEQEEDE